MPGPILADMHCELCAIEINRAPQARFCGDDCRDLYRRLSRSIPDDLRVLNRWVRYSESKVPLTVDGRPASSTDSSTWVSYRRAVAAARVGVGIGFVLNGDGIVCVDLDRCIHRDGRIAPWAVQIIRELGPTWVENSPSGQGLHIWGRGFVERGRRQGRIEVYGTGRYMTVTGKRVRNMPVALGELGDVARILG